MKTKRIAVLVIFAFSIFSFSQKIKIEKEPIKVELKKSDFFKNLKSYNIIIQKGKWGGNLLSSGESGTEYAHPETKTYEHLMSDKFLDEIDLERQVENPDIKIYVGYNGDKPRINNNQLYLEGYFRYLVVDSKGNLLFQDHEKLNAYFINYKDEYPTGGGEAYHIKMANVLKRYAINKLKDLSLTSNYLEDDLPYGTFVKFKKMPELEAFNTKIKALVGKIKNSTLTNEEATEYKTYFESFKGKKIGKLKDKKRDQILALNTSLVDLFTGKDNLFLDAINNVKVGLFTTWPTELKSLHKKLNLLASTNKSDVSVNEHPNLVNTMFIKDAKVKHKGEEFLTDIEIERFLETEDSSLNTNKAPNLFLLDESGNWTKYFRIKDDTQVFLPDSTALVTKKVGVNFLLVENSADDNGCHNIYKNFDNRDGKVCKKDDKFKFIEN